MRSTGLVISILVILLLGALIYIGIIQYGAWDEKRQITANAVKEAENRQLLENGALFGYEQAIATLYSEAIRCQPVPVKYDNQTIQVIAIGCPGTESIVQAMQQAQ